MIHIENHRNRNLEHHPLSIKLIPFYGPSYIIYIHTCGFIPNPWFITRQAPVAGSLNILFNHQLSPSMWEQWSINARLRPAGLWTTFGLIQGMRLCMSVYDMNYIIYVCKCIYTRRYWYAYENQYDNGSCLETCINSTHPSRCMWGLGWLPPKNHMFLASIGTHGGRGMLWSARRLTWLHQAKGHRKFLADHAQSQAYEHHRPAWEAITEVVRIMLRGCNTSIVFNMV